MVTRDWSTNLRDTDFIELTQDMQVADSGLPSDFYLDQLRLSGNFVALIQSPSALKKLTTAERSQIERDAFQLSLDAAINLLSPHLAIEDRQHLKVLLLLLSRLSDLDLGSRPASLTPIGSRGGNVHSGEQRQLIEDLLTLQELFCRGGLTPGDARKRIADAIGRRETNLGLEVTADALAAWGYAAKKKASRLVEKGMAEDTRSAGRMRVFGERHRAQLPTPEQRQNLAPKVGESLRKERERQSQGAWLKLATLELERMTK
jgi:hypothetical protein